MRAAAALIAILISCPIVRGQQLGESAEIYLLALKAVAPGLKVGARLALADTTTDFSGEFRDLQGRKIDAKPETIAAFLTASAATVRLPETLALVPGLLVFSEAKISELRAFTDIDLDVVPKNAVKVREVLRATGIGFDSAHSEALVFVDYSCGGLCGKGILVFLVRDGDSWRVKKTELWSVS